MPIKCNKKTLLERKGNRKGVVVATLFKNDLSNSIRLCVHRLNLINLFSNWESNRIRNWQGHFLLKSLKCVQKCINLFHFRVPQCAKHSFKSLWSLIHGYLILRRNKCIHRWSHDLAIKEIICIPKLFNYVTHQHEGVLIVFKGRFNLLKVCLL